MKNSKNKINKEAQEVSFLVSLEKGVYFSREDYSLAQIELEDTDLSLMGFDQYLETVEDYCLLNKMSISDAIYIANLGFTKRYQG
jgi:hypothetical protein